MAKVQPEESKLRSTLSYNLSHRIKSGGYTQAQVADATGISTSALSSYCQGARYPRPNQLEALAKFFHISVAELTDTDQARNLSSRHLSQEAYIVASSFDELDDHGRELVRLILDSELRRVNGYK